MQVRLVDLVAVGTPGGWVPLTGRRAQRVLAALAVADSPVPAERLAEHRLVLKTRLPAPSSTACAWSATTPQVRPSRRRSG